MKVVFLSRLFYPHIGGVEKHVFEISNVLAKKGHSITIIAEKSKGSDLGKRYLLNLNKLVRVQNISVSRNESRKKWGIWEWFYKNREIIKDADVVHCHDVFFWYLPFRLLYPRKKVFTTFHGYETRFPPAKKAIAVRKLSEIMSNGNICVGSYIKKWYKTKPDIVTYGAVAKSLPVKTVVKRKLRIVFIGRIDEDNGVLEYTKILDGLNKEKISYNFIALGEGKMRDIFKKRGVVKTSTNVLEEIKKADLVFASSYLSILESLSQARLVVSVINNPLKKDYLIDTPFSKWIEASDRYEDLLDSVKNFVASPEKYEKKLLRGSAWAGKQTWENLASQYEALWKRSINN